MWTNGSEKCGVLGATTSGGRPSHCLFKQKRKPVMAGPEMSGEPKKKYPAREKEVSRLDGELQFNPKRLDTSNVLPRDQKACVMVGLVLRNKEQADGYMRTESEREREREILIDWTMRAQSQQQPHQRNRK